MKSGNLNMEKIKVFGYARKSPDDKEETESSILNQIKIFKLVCEQMRWELIDVFIDANTSGSERDRKQFGIMMRRIFQEDVSYIVVKDQDRYVRDSSIFRDTLIDLEANNKAVYSYMKGGFLSHEDLGDSVNAILNDNYVFIQRKKCKILFNQKKNEGLPISKAPFGYKNDKKKGFVINPKEVQVVVDVCSSYAQGIDYKDIIKKNKLSVGRYYRIIKNAENGLYNGYIYYQKKIKNSGKIVIRVEDVRYKGIHEPIISEELFKKINPNFKLE